MKNLFIAESSIGHHHQPPKEFKADTLTFVFLPNMTHKFSAEKFNDFSALLPTNLSNVCFNKKNIKMTSLLLLSMVKKYEKIFIGTDMDAEGNAMAKVLLDFFLCVAKKDIKDVIRIPLTNNGYIAVSNFWDNETMLSFTNNRKDELSFIQKSKTINGSFGTSRRTMLLVNEILNPPEYVENINREGTSSITYMFKKAIKEK